MDFGVTGKLGGYYLAEQYRKNAAGRSEGISFAELAAAKAAGQSAGVRHCQGGAVGSPAGQGNHRGTA